MINPRQPYPELRVGDIATGQEVRFLLAARGFPDAQVKCEHVRYLLVTDEWMTVLYGRVAECKEATGLSGSAVLVEGANAAFSYHYLRPWRPFEDRYRRYPYDGISVGELKYKGREYNFYVTRAADRSLELHIINPDGTAASLKHPLLTTNICY